MGQCQNPRCVHGGWQNQCFWEMQSKHTKYSRMCCWQNFDIQHIKQQ